MQKVIELVQAIEREKERIRALEAEISQAYEQAGEDDWPGNHELLDHAQRYAHNAIPSLNQAGDTLAQFIGTAEIENAGVAR